MIGPFLLMEMLCGLSGMIRLLAQLETRRGNLGKVENTRCEGRGEVCCHVRSSDDGSLSLCRLRTTSVGP
jgi:hypothetical protein